ncbi:hypothetical protein C0J52_00768 [Blattella germanica]|nr:hypothetical protein C0J52_00768 [Blattella germanica]
MWGRVIFHFIASLMLLYTLDNMLQMMYNYYGVAFNTRFGIITSIVDVNDSNNETWRKVTYLQKIQE